MNLDLFPEGAGPVEGPEAGSPADAPLADRMRPRSLDEVVGQDDILGPGRFLRRVVEGGRLPSMLFWGPPGTGKTTLSFIIARSVRAHFVSLSAVTSGVRDIKGVVAAAREHLKAGQRKTVLFIDEIHRFNKAQQDALLPHVERGTLTLIGATTENPSFEVNSALLSRLRVLTLKPLSTEALGSLARRALGDSARGLGDRDQTLAPETLDRLVHEADGDARRLLNILESASGLTAKGSAIAAETLQEAMQSRTLLYDRAGEEHFNIVSALHKSIRDSDPDAALYWLARMLVAGEDRLYVARRLIRIAAEDIGLADPQALIVAVAARDSFRFLGEPEGDLSLAECTVYLALAPKSNAVYRAFKEAVADAETHGSLPVPLPLRNAATALMSKLGYGRGYEYAHDQPEAIVNQQRLPDELVGRRYYAPTSHGAEAALAARLAKLRAAWGGDG